MKTLSKTMIAASLSLFAIAPAFASHGVYRPPENRSILERLERQQHRIDQGVENRQLTYKEAKLLRRQQREIRHMARRFFKDGSLSKRERHWLNRELNLASLQIKRFTHNDLNRYVELHQRYGHNKRFSSL
jgi:septal ring factor EnvC (AmiA/AmiB activator)